MVTEDPDKLTRENERLSAEIRQRLAALDALAEWVRQPAPPEPDAEVTDPA